MQCQTVGIIGNGYAVGQINALVDVYDYYSECKNVTASEGGADRTTDDEYYELMRNSMDTFSRAGARGGYIYWAKQVSTEIADVVVNSPTPGVIKIYVLMEGGAQMKSEVLGLFRSFVPSQALTAVPQSPLSLKSVWIWHSLVPPNVYAAGPA